MNIGLSRILKIGTSASGHWGHAGRPGLIGGSAPGEGEERIMTQTSFGFGDAFTTGKVTTAGIFPKSHHSLNKVYVVEIEGDGKGILKNEYMEQDGSIDNFCDDVLDKTGADLFECSMTRREVIASEVDNILGMKLVPKTVLKDLDELVVEDASEVLDGPSSCQAYVEGFKSVGKMGMGETNVFVRENRGTIYRAAAFDYLIGSCDRHKSNVGVGRDGKLVLIDNGYSFAKTPEGAWNGNLAECALSHINIYEKDEYRIVQRDVGKSALSNERAINKVFKKYGLPRDEQDAFWYRATDMKDDEDPITQDEFSHSSPGSRS